MSEEQLKAFLEKVKGDTSLQEKLKAAADAETVVVIAKETGFSISADDLTNAKSELSEKELEAVAGGAGFWADDIFSYVPGRDGGCMFWDRPPRK